MQNVIYIGKTSLSPAIIDLFTKFQTTIFQVNDIHIRLKLDTQINCILIEDIKLSTSDHHKFVTLHQLYHAPIIIITKTPEELACIEYLEQGADDYVSFNIHPRELHARIIAVTKRTSNQHFSAENKRYCFDNIVLLPQSRRVLGKEGKDITLSKAEFDLLLIFLQSPNTVLSREQLMQASSSHLSSDNNDRKIDVQISRLRHKLNMGNTSSMIKSIRNAGYMFSAKVELLTDATS